MNKPISLLINDAKINITKAINESNLPPCLMQPIIKSIYEEILSQCEEELQNDMAKYNASSGKQKNKEQGNDGSEK